MSTKATALPKPEADALETLQAAVNEALASFNAIQKRVAGGGKVQRLGPGVWIVTHEAPETFNEQEPE